MFTEASIGLEGMVPIQLIEIGCCINVGHGNEEWMYHDKNLHVGEAVARDIRYQVSVMNFFFCKNIHILSIIISSCRRMKLLCID